jgi:hypothetical protein
MTTKVYCKKSVPVLHEMQRKWRAAVKEDKDAMLEQLKAKAEADRVKREEAAAAAKLQRKERAHEIVNKVIRLTLDNWEGWKGTRQAALLQKALSAKHVQPQILADADKELQEKLKECKSLVEAGWKREKEGLVIIQKHWRWHLLRRRFFRSINLGKFDLPTRGRVKCLLATSDGRLDWERRRTTTVERKLTQGEKRATRKKAQKERTRNEQRGRAALDESCPSPKPPPSPQPQQARQARKPMIVTAVKNSSSFSTAASSSSDRTGEHTTRTQAEIRTMRAVQVIDTVRANTMRAQSQQRRSMAIERQQAEMERITGERQAASQAAARQAAARHATTRPAAAEQAAASARPGSVEADDPATGAWLRGQTVATKAWSLGKAVSEVSDHPPPDVSDQPLQECVVCQDEKPTHAGVPCGHLCACATCSKRLNSCPLCRKPSPYWMKIFHT